MKFSNFLQFILPILGKTKNYARIVGVILFAIGLLGFAFRTDNSLPDLYLVGAIILGFWGIISGLLDQSFSKLIEPESIEQDSE